MDLQKCTNSYSKVRAIAFLCLVAGTSTNALKLELGNKKSIKGRRLLIVSKALVGQITVAVCVAVMVLTHTHMVVLFIKRDESIQILAVA